MEPYTSGTMAGTGAFSCAHCGHVVTLATEARRSDCPACGSPELTRASLYGGPRFERPADEATAGAPRSRWLERTRESIAGTGQFLAYDDAGRTVVIPLEHEWTRIGRSLAADVRFDDTTVSRRHALIVRQPDGVRVLDDRSLNGVFVNGERVEWSALGDGDEIVVGRYRMTYLEVVAAAHDAEPASELPIGA